MARTSKMFNEMTRRSILY